MYRRSFYIISIRYFLSDTTAKAWHSHTTTHRHTRYNAMGTVMLDKRIVHSFGSFDYVVKKELK